MNKYADQPDRVVLVRKELGGIPNPCETVEKPKLSVPWFWQLKETQVIAFSDVESIALENKYSSRDSVSSGQTCINIKLPGSDERYDVDFATMTMKCSKGQKTKIFRGLGGSEGSKAMRLV